MALLKSDKDYTEVRRKILEMIYNNYGLLICKKIPTFAKGL